MVEETFKIKQKTFEEEMPESYKIILARSPKKQMKDAQWYFLTKDKKELHLHDLKYEYYMEQCAKTYIKFSGKVNVYLKISYFLYDV